MEIIKNWFFITSLLIDNNQYIYTLDQKATNTILTVKRDSPFSINHGNIRISGSVECLKIEDSVESLRQIKIVCNGIEIKEEPCKPEESLYLYGNFYC